MNRLAFTLCISLIRGGNFGGNLLIDLINFSSCMSVTQVGSSLIYLIFSPRVSLARFILLGFFDFEIYFAFDNKCNIKW